MQVKELPQIAAEIDQALALLSQVSIVGSSAARFADATRVLISAYQALQGFIEVEKNGKPG